VTVGYNVTCMVYGSHVCDTAWIGHLLCIWASWCQAQLCLPMQMWV